MATMMGADPTTFSVTGRCSAVELHCQMAGETQPGGAKIMKKPLPLLAERLKAHKYALISIYNLPPAMC